MRTDLPRNVDCEKSQGPVSSFDLDQDSSDAYGQMGTAGCERPMSSAEILAEFFKYHPPTSETLPKFAAINQAAKNFAEVVLQNCPSSADRSAAIRLIRDARMTANAAIALNGLSL